MNNQRRRGDGKFRSSYSDERLYELLCLTALRVSPLDPAALSQPRFDARALEVAAERGWPEPPRANAIYMRLTRTRKRTWRQLVESAIAAVAGSLTQTANAQVREFPAWWFDERHIYFGLHRVLQFVQQREEQKPEMERRVWETLTYDQYEFGRLDLLASVRGERRAYLDMVLPTAGQIYVMAGRDWNMGLRLAQLPEPVGQRRLGTPLFTLLDHYYNSERRIPANHEQLRLKYNALEIAVPRRPVAWERFLVEWRADRATRGLQTPTEGPAEDQQLGQVELDALLADAPRRLAPGSWTPERIVAKYSEYIDEFDGVVRRLTQKHYKAVCPGRGWPSWTVIYKHATPGRKTKWEEMVALGQRYLAEQRRAA